MQQGGAADGVKSLPLQSTKFVKCLLQCPSRALNTRLGWLQGRWAGHPVAVKVYNLREDGSVAAYEREKIAYKGLKSLQGLAIPYFLRSGVLVHTGAPVIVSSYEGIAIDHDKLEPVPKHLHRAMKEALEALHAAGAAHCAGHSECYCSRFTVDGDAVRLADLEGLVLNATEEQKSGDLWALDALLA